jgi:tetratricopeptide (TPR) repeat protein
VNSRLPTLPRWTIFSGFVALAILQAPAQSAPVMQKPADERAYAAAVALIDPAQRVAALDNFIKIYPKSKRIDRAQSVRFDTCVEYLPDRTADLKQAAKGELKTYQKGSDKLSGKAEIAEKYAEAGQHGILLHEAEKLATQAEHHLDEAEWNSDQAKLYKKYNDTLPKPAELHKKYLEFAGNIHLALADVYLHQGKPAPAKPLLDEAFAANPTDIATNAIRAEYALATGDKTEAIADLVRAEVSNDTSEVFSDLGQKYYSTLVQLYRDTHNGSDSGLEAVLDDRYKELYPPPFGPDKVAPIRAGHTALLELFTGSGCPPCIGGDIAVDTLLGQYPRTELIALSFDQHVPRPDPLANSDSIDRAKLFDRGGTPSYVLDGVPLALFGASRDGSKGIYEDLQKMAATEITAPTNVKLTLVASFSPEGAVLARAAVSTGTQESTTKLVTSDKPKAPPGKEDKKATTAKPAAPTPSAPPPVPHLVVNFALAEDDVRYSGENGMRFHRMVVRSLAQPAVSGFPLLFEKTTNAEASFNLDAISAKLHSYLIDFAKSNDIFGPLQWRSMPTTINPRHLYVVAWVQDITTHRVLQSAFAAVNRDAPGNETAATGSQ